MSKRKAQAEVPPIEEGESEVLEMKTFLDTMSSINSKLTDIEAEAIHRYLGFDIRGLVSYANEKQLSSRLMEFVCRPDRGVAHV